MTKSEIVSVADDIGISAESGNRLVIWDIHGYTPLPKCTLDWVGAQAIRDFINELEAAREDGNGHL